ncbi:hypothetical protein Terro_1540 [Terriglobus roseus DSM 18391]|uniref:DUF4234 domain-containing protein n=1 Tax=Terriglobus roseus (strain DSM 18391 / NRRL B-41598 / KBS 63) TaxID=926566 RepID=I3ZF29_TERRK|nr:hypothetical protein [Terriglobus roseus]AFL87847.1 hypothetical protein Terro_1540 [Terriglobus roseus DSM 18391]
MANVIPPPSPAYDPRYVPPPVRLHWGWVLALSLLTRGYFNSIWMVVQANWIKRVTGREDVLWWSIANVAMLPVLVIIGIMAGVTMALVPHLGANDGSSSTLLVGANVLGTVLYLAVYVKTVFTLREALELPPIGIPLGGVMTFLFSGIYFQYMLHDHVVPGPEEVYGTMQPPAYVPVASPEPRA